MRHTITADRGDAGVRLDLVLRRHLAGTVAATRTLLQHWIEEGRVSINDVVVRRASTRAASGSIVTVSLPDSAARMVMEPEPVPLEVLYEDEDLLVVNKPAGMVVHPTYGHQRGTIMNGLLWRALEWAEGARPSIVGRLDKQTSGLVIVARSAMMHAMLQQGLARRASEKDYLAVVAGEFAPEPQRINLRLRRDPADRRRVIASSTEGLASLTIVHRLAVARPSTGPLSLLRCRLMTGRMHQIRVHLAASGSPIVGDSKYGVPLAGLPRQALHAWRVAFVHPRSAEPLRIEAPLPADMTSLIAGQFPDVMRSFEQR